MIAIQLSFSLVEYIGAAHNFEQHKVRNFIDRAWQIVQSEGMKDVQLQRMVRKYLAFDGRGAKERLAVKAGLSMRLIEKVVKGHVPKDENIVAILKAMGEPIPDSLFETKRTKKTG